MPAVSKAQQRFMGMVHAVQKGDMEAPSKEIEKAADTLSDKDAKDYASTSHKGLPNKKENMITRERLKEIVKDVMTEESEYQAFFQKALDKAGKSIPSMSDDEKKVFFNKIDTAWNGKGEKNEELTGNQHKLDIDKDGDIGSDDLADLRAGKKTNEAGPGLWANIKAKQDRGEAPARKGSKAHKDAVAAGKRINNEETVIEVGDLPSAQLPSAIKSKLIMAIDKMKDSKLTFNQKIQVIVKVMDSLGVDKGEFNKMSSKLKGTMESNIKEDRGPCWQGYKQVGMKDKGGRQVPNCVKEGKMNEANDKLMKVGSTMMMSGSNLMKPVKMKLVSIDYLPKDSKYSYKFQGGGRTQYYTDDVLAKKLKSEKVNEAVAPKDMDKIKSAVEAAKSFMSVGAELKKLGMKYTFATEPLAIYIVQPTPNNKVAIVNKRYASKPDFVVGDIAVGIMEGTSVSEGLWPKSKLPQSFQFALAPELKKNFKGIFYSVGNDIYHNDKKVLSVDGDRDSVNSIIAKLKKIVK